MSSSDLEYRRSNNTEAEEFARLGKDKAVEMGLNMEACQARFHARNHSRSYNRQWSAAK